jgi:hypothetical protein
MRRVAFRRHTALAWLAAGLLGLAVGGVAACDDDRNEAVEEFQDEMDDLGEEVEDEVDDHS